MKIVKAPIANAAEPARALVKFFNEHDWGVEETTGAFHAFFTFLVATQPHDTAKTLVEWLENMSKMLREDLAERRPS
jgi:hypothetical protein